MDKNYLGESPVEYNIHMCMESIYENKFGKGRSNIVWGSFCSLLRTYYFIKKKKGKRKSSASTVIDEIC